VTPGLGAAERRLRTVDTFVESLRALKAEPLTVRTKDETVAALKRVFEKTSPSLTVTAGLPADVMDAVTRASGTTVAVAEQLTPGEATSVLGRAELGITWAEYGVADVGALVEITYEDAHRLASSLPINHVAIVREKNVLPDLRSAMLEAGRVVANSRPRRKPVVTFISGPSRTADIEGRLLLGAHGPHSLYVLVLGWA
jgi:L-lactate dehydrogenase complex protein LldG